ncbi:MAG TPA: hypothetical protein VER33_08095, partial [Polyangiaceae bacterium]|nr:hypothetical protein [Polyangiaceae bacterium]
AIAMNTNNLQKQYLMATAGRVLVIEKALNQRNVPALLEACEPSVLVDGEAKTQAQLGRLIEKDFSSAPDLVVTNGSCDVSVQSKKVTKRAGRQKRKVVTYETQGWTARCEQTATLAGKASARTVTYHFSAASKLREIVTRAE